MAPPNEWFLRPESQPDCAAVVTQHVAEPAMHLLNAGFKRTRARIFHAENDRVWHVQHLAAFFKQREPCAFVVAGYEFDFTVQPVFDSVILKRSNELWLDAVSGAKQRKSTRQDLQLSRKAKRLHVTMPH